MTELLSLPWYITVVPVCAIVGAIAVSKALNISQLASLVGATLPLGLPYADISVSSHSLLSKPPVQILGGWGMMLALALSWVVMRALLRAVKGPAGLVRAVYSLLLGVAGLVVVLLLADPRLLHTYVPDWRGSFGAASVALTIIRIFKSAAFLVVCSVATLILASQIFFEKMPYDLEREDIHKIERSLPASLPKGIVESGFEGLLKAGASTRSALRSVDSDDRES
jgi:hypothetical protein